MGRGRGEADRAALYHLEAPCWNIIIFCSVLIAGLTTAGWYGSQMESAKEKFREIVPAACGSTDYGFEWMDGGGDNLGMQWGQTEVLPGGGSWDAAGADASAPACPALADPIASLTPPCPVVTGSGGLDECNVSALSTFLLQKCDPLVQRHAQAQCERSCMSRTPRACRTSCEKAVARMQQECFFLDSPLEQAEYHHPTVARQTLRYLRGQTTKVDIEDDIRRNNRCSYNTFADVVLNNCDRMGCMIAPNSSIAYDNYNENATVSGACFVATCPSTLPVLPNSHEATGHVCTATGHGGLCNATCANGYEPGTQSLWNGHRNATIGVLPSGLSAVQQTLNAAEVGAFRCGIDGKWDSTGGLLCVARTCPSFSPADSITVCNGKTGDVCNFICDQGYTNNGTLSCSWNGNGVSFTGGQCVANSCAEFTAPNGNTTCNAGLYNANISPPHVHRSMGTFPQGGNFGLGVTTGQTCNITCNAGFTLLGENVCARDGFFRGATCSAKMVDPLSATAMDAQIRGAAVVYGCNGDYTSNGCGWQKSWDPATYKSNCAQCGAMLTTQVRPFAMDSAFDGIYTTEDLHYFQMREGTFLYWQSFTREIVTTDKPHVLIYDFGVGKRMGVAAYAMTGAIFMVDSSPMIWQLQGGTSFDRMRDVDYTSPTAVVVSPDANGNAVTNADWTTVHSQDCSPGVTDTAVCTHGGPYSTMNERRYMETNYTAGQEYRYYRLAVGKTKSQLASPPSNYGTQVVELELFPPALLSAKLPIPFGDGNGTAALLSAVEVALSNSIVGPVYVMTKDLVTGDSNAIYMKLLLTGATPDAQLTALAQLIQNDNVPPLPTSCGSGGVYTGSSTNCTGLVPMFCNNGRLFSTLAGAASAC